MNRRTVSRSRVQKWVESLYLPTYLSEYLHTYLSDYLPTYLSDFLSINLPIWLYTYLSIWLPTYLPTSHECKIIQRKRRRRRSPSKRRKINFGYFCLSYKSSNRGRRQASPRRPHPRSAFGKVRILNQKQCDQIGRVFYLLGNKFSYKSSPNILVNFGAVYNNTTFM